jgi:hypothetical protein
VETRGRIFVDRELVAEFHRAARLQGKTMRSLVERFMRDYIYAVTGYMKLGVPLKEAKGMPGYDPRKPFVPPPLPKKVLDQLPIDPRVCGHIRVLEIEYGRWCRDCGCRLAP